MMFEGVLHKRFEKIVSELAKVISKDEGYTNHIIAIRGQIDFKEKMDYFADILHDWGYGGRPVHSLREFNDLLRIHALECGKKYMLFSFNILKNKKLVGASKDELFKSVDMKDFEVQLDGVRESKDFVVAQEFFLSALREKGFNGALNINMYHDMLRVHGIQASMVFFEYAMKFFELVKRRVR